MGGEMGGGIAYGGVWRNWLWGYLKQPRLIMGLAIVGSFGYGELVSC